MSITLTEDQQRLLLLSFAQDRHRYNADFYEFFKDAWEAVDPMTPLIENWHIKYQCFIAQKLLDRLIARQPAETKTLLINVPPRSLKSWIFNIALPVYAWTKASHLPMITASYALDLAEGFSRKSQQIIRSNWFQRRYGDIVKIEQAEGGREAVRETMTSAGGARYITATEGTAVGKGLMIGIVDDPLKPMQAKEEKALQNAINFFEESIDTRRNDPSLAFVVVIMQRLAEGDLAGYLIEKYDGDKDFLHINLPAIQDGTEKVPYLDEFLKKHPEETNNIYKGGYLFGDRFDDNFIKKQQKKGTIFWNTQYQQNPLPTDGLLFKREWFPKISFDEFAKLERLHHLRRTFVADTAYTDKTINDPTGMLTYTTYENTTYLINFTTDHVDSANLPEWIEDYVQRNGYDNRKSVITIEPKGSGMVVISLLKKLTNLNVIPYKYPPAAKVNVNMSKEIRAEAVVPMVESGRIVLVEGLWNEAFLAQVTTFPLAKNDEAVDTMVMAILRSHYIDQRYKKFGLKRRVDS